MQREVRRPRYAAALLVATAALFGACGDATSDAPTTTVPPAATVSTTTAGDAAPATHPTTSPPLTTESAAATSDVTAAAPQRIVSLSATLTEMLFAVGAGDQVVAVDRYSNHPPGVPATDLSGFKPNVEAIAALDPDLVVLSSDRDGIVAALDAIGVASIVLTSAVSVDDALDQLDAIGAATGHEAAAARLMAELRAEIELQVARVPEREEPLTYFIELSDDGNSATSATFLGNVLTLAGLTSIADASPDSAGRYPQLSAEAVLEADPDVILLAHSNGANPTIEEIATRPGWSELRAVASGHVVALDPDVASRWGPRIVELLAGVVDATSAIS